MAKETRRRDKFTPLTITMLVVLSIYVFLLAFLLLWAVMQVFKSGNDFTYNPIWWPRKNEFEVGFTLENFQALFTFAEEASWTSSDATNTEKITLADIIFNSVSYSIGGAFVNTAAMCLMAYLAARYNYFYSKLIHTIVIVVMVIPIVGAQASEIAVLDALGLYNTRFGFIILKAGFVGLYFLVFYETFKSIPMTYSEAAMMDGASDWCIMTKICLPLTINVFMTIMLITFIQYWNDYQMAMLYMPNYPTLSYFLFKAQSTSANILIPNGESVNASQPPFQMAATVILMMPILVIFVLLHERLMGNLSIGGIKG